MSLLKDGNMEINELEEGFVRLVFPPRTGKGKHFGFNLYAFLGEGESILLDSGFREHGESAGAWLNEQGFPLRRVILSHFHHDHIFGLKALPNMETWGSGRFQETFDLYTRPEEQSRFIPTHIVDDGEAFTFGRFHFKFLVRPGHAACNLYTIINERYIHVGDDISASNEGRQLLPSVELFRIGDHIDSLEMLKEYARLTFLPSHGPPLRGEKEILHVIGDRQRYLKAVAANPLPIPLEQALAGCTIEFLHAEWHQAMYEMD
jgi:glyoxylase-like metal-dependent hydrolase (beta-lactamase superfamily II)